MGTRCRLRFTFKYKIRKVGFSSNLQQRRLLRLEENPTFLILYLNVNLERHLVVVPHDDFDRRMIHIPVQVDHFVEEIQALQQPLTTLSRSHVMENSANCLDENVFVAKLGPHVLLFDDRSIPEINKKHQNFFRCSRSVLEWSVAQNSTPIPLTVIPPEQNLIRKNIFIPGDISLPK